MVDELMALGHEVDPILERYLTSGVHVDFAPVTKYQVGVGGKRVRSALTLLCCEASGAERSKALLPAAMIELIHNYSLIMDDIIDRGMVRRGRPTVLAKYGDAMALLAGMHHREVLDEIVNDCSKPEQMRILMIEAVKKTIEGERLDILFEQAGREGIYFTKHRSKDISEESYFDMIGKKTATLIRTGCLAGALAADASDGCKESLARYGWKIGLAFQVVDDYLDIFGEKTGKQRGKDIIEHKLGNAVILFALNELGQNSRNRLLRILRTENVNASLLRSALKLLEETEARQKTLEIGQRLIEEGKNSLDTIQESNAKSSLLKLADFVVNRVY
jgi:geranylgeranyl diphosphate synthase type I